MTRETLEFLWGLLSQVNVPLSAPNYDELSTQAGSAKRELLAAIEAATPEEP